MRCVRLRLARKKALVKEVHRVDSHADEFTWCGKKYRNDMDATFMVGPVTCRGCLLIIKNVSKR